MLQNSTTTKMMVDFWTEEASSIKSFAIKEKKAQITTWFLSGKMLIFATLPLMSLIHEMLETFSFPDEEVKEIYCKYLKENVYM